MGQDRGGEGWSVEDEVVGGVGAEETAAVGVGTEDGY